MVPDIIVTGPEGSEIALVVEVKTNSSGLDDSERQLKKFMVVMRSPVGLLVTPERLWLYRDQYLSASEDSITKVGEFDVRAVLNFEPTGAGRNDGPAFERVVQSWLEGLSTESGLRELPLGLRGATQMYIVPAISQGAIRAGHPRSSLIASLTKPSITPSRSARCSTSTIDGARLGCAPDVRGGA